MFDDYKRLQALDISQKSHGELLQQLGPKGVAVQRQLKLSWRHVAPASRPVMIDHDLPKKLRSSLTGWWLGHPSEKYESQLG